MKNTIKNWNDTGYDLIRISSVGEDFNQWLTGQTLPVVVGNKNPYDWAYYHDYERYKISNRLK